jgi:hypothetical protein
MIISIACSRARNNMTKKNPVTDDGYGLEHSPIKSCPENYAASCTLNGCPMVKAVTNI